QSECTLVCETIENPPTGRVLRDSGVILRLIEIKSRFLRVQKIDIELQSVDFNFDWSGRRGALQNSSSQIQSLSFPHRRIISLDDCDPSKNIDNCSDNQGFPQIHRQRERLQNK